MVCTELIEAILASTGSTWVKEPELIKNAKRYRISTDKINTAVEKGIIVKLICDGIPYYTLPKYALWEMSVADNALRIQNNYHLPQNITISVINELIADGETYYGRGKLAEEQREAVICAVLNGLAIITGGPGTGKTFTLQIMSYVLYRLNYKVDIRFTAPTGKASRRITESTGRAAKTTQKELGITFTNKNMKMFGGNVLIIDEVSMLDLETAYYVFRAIISGQKLILVGDINQLPSVGPGAVLRDLLESGAIPFVRLIHTFRQAEGSNLLNNIELIKNGEWRMQKGTDFDIIQADEDPDNQIQQLITLFKRETTAYGTENVACLLPYRKAGVLCSDYMNNILQAEINPIGNKKYMLSHTEKGLNIKFTVGDPVMQLQNRAECANGDVGFVKDFDRNQIIVTYSDGTTVNYSNNNIQELALAYSMSINKSQGSEYKSVVMAITSAHKAMLKRNLVYTGITRAKQNCVLLQEDAAMIKAISCEEEYERTTFLTERLQYLKRCEKYHIG